MSELKKCPICLKPSSSSCSNCKKVVYCGKEHQKEDRKRHKLDCYPARLTTHPVLGQHLSSSRDISAGEKIFKEAPLIIGPRSNLSHFHKICLGCCDEVRDNYLCTKCLWSVCDVKCEQNPSHAKFECPILTGSKVPPAQSQEEYLCITFLRCILLQEVDPPRWDALLKFESHVELRGARPICVEQSHFAVHFIRNVCKMSQVDAKLIDFVYGIIIVNGYGDPSTFAVKLYSKSAKLSHACISNTTTKLTSSGLEIVATVDIPAGQPLTQLYGRIFKGTHRRQELLQNIYFFSCTCPRCKDPSELGTHFSSIKCPMGKKCDGGHLLPKNPLDISPTSKWKCNRCTHSAAFIRCVVPALAEIRKESETDENDALYSEYEMYRCDNPAAPLTEDDDDDEEVTAMKVDYVLKMLHILRKLETRVVHPNHYALLPLKTALIASIHSILARANDKEEKDKDVNNETMNKNLLQEFLKMVKELLQVVDVLFPGMTSERGLLLFYLSEGMRFSIKNGNLSGPNNIHMELQEQLTKLQEESLKIMLLDREDDDHRQLVLKYLGKSLKI